MLLFYLLNWRRQDGSNINMSIAGFLSKKIDGRSFSELTQKKAMAPRCHSAIVITLLIIFRRSRKCQSCILPFTFIMPPRDFVAQKRYLKFSFFMQRLFQGCNKKSDRKIGGLLLIKFSSDVMQLRTVNFLYNFPIIRNYEQTGCLLMYFFERHNKNYEFSMVET